MDSLAVKAHMHCCLLSSCLIPQRNIPITSDACLKEALKCNFCSDYVSTEKVFLGFNSCTTWTTHSGSSTVSANQNWLSIKMLFTMSESNPADQLNAHHKVWTQSSTSNAHSIQSTDIRMTQVLLIYSHSRDSSIVPLFAFAPEQVSFCHYCLFFPNWYRAHWPWFSDSSLKSDVAARCH